MSIIWCGGEDIDFPEGSITISTYGGSYRSSYSRCSIHGGARFYSNPFQGGEVTSAWLGFRYYGQNYGVTHYILGLVGDDGVTGYWLYSNNKVLTLRKYDGGWSTVASDPHGATFYTYSSQPVAMRITNYGASGNIKVYRWDYTSPVIDYSGDLSISGLTGFSRVAGYGNSGVQYGCMSEVIVADEDTRLMSLKTLAPNASGDTNDWNNDYDSIDELTKNDTDLINVNSVDKDFLCNLQNLPAGDFSIKAVKSNIRASDVLASRGIQVGVKTNSVVHLGSTNNLSAVWEQFEQLYNDNPETTSQFTPSEIDALQLAVRSKAAV